MKTKVNTTTTHSARAQQIPSDMQYSKGSIDREKHQPPHSIYILTSLWHWLVNRDESQFM